MKILFILLVLFSSCISKKEPEKESKINQEMKLPEYLEILKKGGILVVTEDYRPFSYEEDGEIKGSATKLVKKVLAEINRPSKIFLFPWTRSYEFAQTLENVLIYTLGRTQLREDKFKWVRPVTKPTMVYFYKLKSNKELKLNSLNDLKKYRTVVMQDTFSHQYLLNLKDPKLKDGEDIYPQTSWKGHVNFILKGRADLILLGEKEFLEGVKALNIDPNLFEKAMFALKVDSYMAYSLQTSDQLVKETIDAFDKLKAQNQMEIEQ